MSITMMLSHEAETLETLRDEWINLQTRSSAKGMALTWQWVHIWHKYFDHFGELWILTAREDNRLIGIAPLMKVEVQPDYGLAWQQLEFIGASYEHDHLDFIIEPGYEEQLIPLFIDELHAHKSRWDTILLTALCNTKTPDILQRTNREWVESPGKNLITVHTTLPDTMEEYMLSISRRHRKKLRRYRNLMDKQFPDRWSIIQVTQPDELDYTLDQLVSMHQSQWEAKGGPGIFHYGELTGYYRELMHCLLENGWLRLYHLKVEDKTCAVDFSYHYRGRAYGQIRAVTRAVKDVTLGDVLMHHGIEQAVSEGMGEYSFSLGEHSWKYSFGGVNQVQQAFQLVSSSRVRLQLKTLEGLRGIKSRIRNMTPDEIDRD